MYPYDSVWNVHKDLFKSGMHIHSLCYVDGALGTVVLQCLVCCAYARCNQCLLSTAFKRYLQQKYITEGVQALGQRVRQNVNVDNKFISALVPLIATATQHAVSSSELLHGYFPFTSLINCMSWRAFNK
jgi:hypothetical protein